MLAIAKTDHEFHDDRAQRFDAGVRLGEQVAKEVTGITRRPPRTCRASLRAVARRAGRTDLPALWNTRNIPLEQVSPGSFRRSR